MMTKEEVRQELREATDRLTGVNALLRELIATLPPEQEDDRDRESTAKPH